MKRSDFKYLVQENFLTDSEYQELILSLFFVPHKPEHTKIINKDGSIFIDFESPKTNRIRAYNSNLEIWKQILPNSAVELMYKMREVVYNHGFKNPQPREYVTYYNPSSLEWHKDFNIENHPDHLRYLTLFTMSDIPGDHTVHFVVSPTEDGPGLWKIGLDQDVKSNTLIFHSQTLGHKFTKNTEGIPMHVFAVQWYEV